MLFNYTAQLREYFENLPVNADQSLPHRTVIENGRSSLFDFDYPIFDDAYKNVFETHFIRKFYMRQIGFETFGLFKFQLETWLIINMPYFNKLFESELLQYDPLTNSKMETNSNRRNDKTQSDNRNVTDNRSIDGETTSNGNRTVNTTHTGTTDNEQTSNMSGTSENTQTKDESGNVTEDNFGRQLESNNPDSRLTITTNDGTGVIEYASSIKEDNENNSKNTTVTGTTATNETSSVDSTNKATTNATDNTDTTDSTSDNMTSNVTQTGTQTDALTSNINDTEDYIEYRIGKIGDQSFAKLVKEYRAALLRVENQIFDEMNQLFMLVY